MWRGSGKDSFIFGWLYKRKGPVIDTHSNLPFPSFFGTGTILDTHFGDFLQPRILHPIIS